MDPVVQAIFFAVAVVLFAVDAWWHKSLTAAGLAAFVFVFFWNAAEAA